MTTTYHQTTICTPDDTMLAVPGATPSPSAGKTNMHMISQSTKSLVSTAQKIEMAVLSIAQVLVTT
eukprot:CAMPEP_0198561828 /NCGR_PEP_ID=MMETSP1462-20131121/96111_1 /TAXON_ID=1333877 /ORGANISM="Brandtodinium nutriculum, Strain RCC3387" /LENGTH=65 /DNA_ID=CAMNT_0044292739 /DNA_START=86 /DNA_END=280 /DNA_ORIENTATION=-